MVTVSEKALEHVIELMINQGISPDTHYLRVGVKGGGCSGLSYAMDFDNTITDMDEVVDLNVLRVIIDKKSLLYLYGTELDYSDGLNGRGFNWVNPQASRTCGCGESFAL
jgi:iron-sulfur cluster assembly protein